MTNSTPEAQPTASHPTEAQPTASHPTEAQTFAPITSQDDLNRIITDRVSRERSKYSDYADLKTKAAEYDKAQEASKTEAQKQADALAAANARIAEFEQRDQVNTWKGEVSKDRPDLRDLLTATTREGLAEQLATLAARIPDPAKPKAAVAPYVPAPASPAGTPQPKPGLDRLRVAYEASPATRK